MTAIDLIRKWLPIEEGVRYKPYMDTVGKVSIGIGRNLSDCGIRKDECELMFTNDVQDALNVLRRNYPIYDQLDEVRQAVLLDMCFNLGWDRLRQFKQMLGHVERGDYISAGAAMLQSKWARQVGKRATTLSRRMKTGQP